MEMREEETNRFETLGDSGRQYTVIEISRFTAHRRTGAIVWVRGGHHLQLADGQDVNENNDGTYEIPKTGELLWRI